MDKKTGLLRLDRILFTSTHYPMNYGFVPRILADDGNPLDVLVLCSEIQDPLTEVDCYPIGVVRMIDNEQVDEVSHFFDVYKALEHSRTSVTETFSREEALKIITNSITRYSDVYRLQDEAH